MGGSRLLCLNVAFAFGTVAFQTGFSGVSGGSTTTTTSPCDFADEANFASVGGGECNVAVGFGAHVGGGSSNSADGSEVVTVPSLLSGAASVGGGSANTAEGGGAVLGGANGLASNLGAVAGGYNNTASGIASFVGGGFANEASGDLAFVGGGEANTASGQCASIAGGSSNAVSGDSSAAIGLNAAVVHDHALVINLKPAAPCNSKGDNTVNICAPNGVFVNGVELTGDRRQLREAAAENFGDSDSDRVAALAQSMQVLSERAASHAKSAAAAAAGAFLKSADVSELQDRVDDLAVGAEELSAVAGAVNAKLRAAEAVRRALSA